MAEANDDPIRTVTTNFANAKIRNIFPSLWKLIDDLPGDPDTARLKSELVLGLTRIEARLTELDEK